MTPTQLSLRELKKLGHVAVDKVEYWNSFAKKRKDLFGFIDVLAVGHGHTLGVQCTSDSNVSSRVKKVKESPVFPLLLEAGWIIEVWGWKKKGGRHVCRVVVVRLDK